VSVWAAVAADGTDPDLLLRAVALASARGGVRALDRLLSAGAALPAAGAGARARATAFAATWHDLDARVALRGDRGWPALRCETPPPLVAWRGAAPVALLARPAVALVGARRASGYGVAVTAWLAEAVAQAGATVVSGGAVGVDAAAHEAAAGAGTLVVLGCGHDVAYPRPHTRPGALFDRVLAGGGALVGEQLPGAVAHPGAVRARNRLVAGYADVVVVVEGGPRSGALLTASAAADAGVPVLAVPGDVRRPGSVAPHRLLAEGAAPCTGPDDVLAALGHAASGSASATGDGGDPLGDLLPAPVQLALSGAWPRPLHVTQLVDVTGLPTGRVLAAVTRGVVAGVLVETLDGVRLRRAP
jgi:DNA processing protein